MSWATSFYNTFFKRNTVMVATVFGASFIYDAVFHSTFDRIYDSINQGKQWKDIKHRYVQEQEDDDE